MKSLLALVAIVFVAGCGDGDGTKGKATSVAQSSTDCAFKEITAGARREGTCTARGVAITVANKMNWLRGTDYDARIRSTRVENGRLVVELAVKNTLDVPHEFDARSNLVFLLVDGKYFGEKPEAEMAELRPPPFRLRRSPLQPDEVAVGTVAFDVPPDQLKQLLAPGSNLILVNYGDEAKGFPTGTEQLEALGYIRLWK